MCTVCSSAPAIALNSQDESRDQSVRPGPGRTIAAIGPAECGCLSIGQLQRLFIGDPPGGRQSTTPVRHDPARHSSGCSGLGCPARMWSGGSFDGAMSLPSESGEQRLCDTGGAEGDRTPDLIIANDALSQLSYCPTLAGRTCGRSTGGCQADAGPGSGASRHAAWRVSCIPVRISRGEGRDLGRRSGTRQPAALEPARPQDQ